MADNSTQVPTAPGDTIRDKDRGGVKTQIFGLDLAVGGAAESLMNGYMPTALATGPQLTQGTQVSAQPHGALRVTPDPTSIFYDSFSGGTLDVTDRWTTSGTAPTQAGGMLTFPSGTASTTSLLVSKVTPAIGASQYLFPAIIVRLESAVGSGVGRFWGLGTVPTTPAVGSLAQEGVGFEVESTAGALQAVTYTGGAKTVIATLTRPTDNLFHRYSMQYRNSRTYWFIDDINVYVTTATFLNTTIQDLPPLISSVSGTTPVNAPSMVVSAVGVSDLNRRGTQIVDGLFPHRAATIKPSSLAAFVTDTAIVVGLHPSSPVPAGTNNIGSVALRDGASTALTSVTLGTRQSLDVNLSGTASGYTTTAGTLTATVPQTTGGSASTTAMVVASVASAGNATITVNTSAFVGTLAFEASDDGGATYYTVVATREDGTGSESLFAINTAALLTRMWTTGIPGMTHFRVRCSAFTSGTAPIRISPGAFLIENAPSLGAGTANIGVVTPVASTTSTLTGIAASITSGQLAASNVNRKGLSFQNDASSGTLYIRLGASAATAASGGHKIALGPTGYYEVPFNYTGAVQGIWSAATGFVNVDEVV